MTVQIRSRWTLALAMAAALLPAGTAGAQEPAGQLAAPSGRTHTVRTGDTLWDLARTYLGDPFLWPEIYRLNTEVVEDPHWIYPGEVLRLPEGSATGVVAAGPEDQGTYEAPPSRAATVFATRRGGLRSGDRMQRGVLGRSERPLVRAGDWYPAPAVVREGGIRGSGKVLELVAEKGIASNKRADRLQIEDRVQVRLPEGRVALAGEKYTTYRLDDVIGNDRQVMVPTGVVQVETIRPTGEVIARIVDLYDQVRIGQLLTLFEPFTTTPTGNGPQPVANGSVARLAWILGDPVLPSLHKYVVLQGGGGDVRMGDQFTLLRDGMEQAGTNPGPDAPETLAVVQVIKVTPGGISAMIIDQQQPGIRVGNAARLTAKMP